jgi:hypothetical protein
MSRLLPIVATLLAGLVGLFMSVCGGGFVITMSYSAMRSFMQSGAQGNWVFPFGIAFPAACAAGGILLLWKSWGSIRKIMAKPRDGD